MHNHSFRIPFNRTAYAVAGLLCFVAAAVLTPSGARSQIIATSDVPVQPAARPFHAPAPIAPERDAFAPRAADDDAAIQPRTSILPAVPAALAGRMQPADRPVSVSAIATGDAPSALVEGDGTARIVSVGDTIGAAQVVAIDAGGIVLSSGRRMQLTTGAP